MAIVIPRDSQKIEKVMVRELSYNLKFNGTGYDKVIHSFEIENDNLPHCKAHYKFLTPEEMIAVYEYMKKVMEGG
jgi:hypothetical protein